MLRNTKNWINALWIAAAVFAIGQTLQILGTAGAALGRPSLYFLIVWTIIKTAIIPALQIGAFALGIDVLDQIRNNTSPRMQPNTK